MTQRLIIIRGNSASGKSTIAKMVRERLGPKTMLVSQDLIRREILFVSDETRNPAIELMYKLVMWGKELGYDVILEGILSIGKYGEMLEKIVKDFDGETYAYYFDISFEETMRRHNTKDIAHIIDEEKMRSWRKESDRMNIHNERTITDEQTQNEIVDLILNELN
jgi:predicted kinase